MVSRLTILNRNEGSAPTFRGQAVESKTTERLFCQAVKTRCVMKPKPSTISTRLLVGKNCKVRFFCLGGPMLANEMSYKDIHTMVVKHAPLMVPFILPLHKVTVDPLNTKQGGL